VTVRDAEDDTGSVSSSSRDAATPFAMVAPVLLLVVAVALVPLLMIALLTFHRFSTATGIEPVFSLENWREICTDPYYAEMFLRTFRIAAIVTALSCLVGAPEAYIIHRMRPPWKGTFLVIALGPLLISVVARTLGWALLFGGANGVVNKLLVSLGLISAPLPFMFTEAGVVIALVHVLAPFVVLSVWAVLQRLDPQIENAAASLGASQATVLWRIVLPQALPGILSGGIITFALAAGAFATPAIIGGRRLKVASTLAYDEFLNTLNWPLGAAVAVLLLVAIAAVVAGCNRLVERQYAAAS
jgi:putative spermidine/putrescine transport system permease protein